MIVDDEHQVLKALDRTLRETGFEVTLYDDPLRAIENMDESHWDLIIADYRMPKLSGLEVLKAAKQNAPYAVRILMTGYADIDVIIKAVNEGSIYKYIAKPWDNQQFLSIVQESVDYKLKNDENRRLVSEIMAENSEWSGIAKSLEHKIMEMSEQGVQALLRTIRAKDEALYKHSLSVAWVSGRVGDSLGLKKADSQTLRLAALFHDIGKIAIRDRILLKTDKLDPDEREQMIHHPEVGAEILKEMDFMREVSEVVLQHHERHDGSGYPRGLSGGSIKTLARILSISDIYVALKEERSYKLSFSNDEAMTIIKNEAGKAVDEIIVERFYKAMSHVEIPSTLAELEERK
jgi:putative nucleotidyltransferase with HDIG domain